MPENPRARAGCWVILPLTLASLVLLFGEFGICASCRWRWAVPLVMIGGFAWICGSARHDAHCLECRGSIALFGWPRCRACSAGFRRSTGCGARTV